MAVQISPASTWTDADFARAKQQITARLPKYRNAAKKAYAAAYVEWACTRYNGTPEPSRGALSYMAAQAVRLDVNAISATLTPAAAPRPASPPPGPRTPDYREAMRRLAAIAKVMPDRCPNLRDYHPDRDAYDAAIARYQATCQGIDAARNRLAARRMQTREEARSTNADTTRVQGAGLLDRGVLGDQARANRPLDMLPADATPTPDVAPTLAPLCRGCEAAPGPLCPRCTQDVADGLAWLEQQNGSGLHGTDRDEETCEDCGYTGAGTLCCACYHQRTIREAATDPPGRPQWCDACDTTCTRTAPCRCRNAHYQRADRGEITYSAADWLTRDDERRAQRAAAAALAAKGRAPIAGGSADAPAHTPGPWGVTHQDALGAVVMTDTQEIAQLRPYVPGAASMDLDTCYANARLIAAAPALLDALKRLAQYTQRQADFESDERALWLQADRIARAAIAAAEGR